MTITFVTNHVHHHQLPLADELSRLLGDDYHYIATKPLPEWLAKGGYDSSLDRSYIIRPYVDADNMKQARELIDGSDVVIMGDAPMAWAVKRKSEDKVTFHYTERIYKEGIPWHKLPWHIYLHYKNFGRYKNTYLLCASAYTAYDFALTHCFLGKSFKWGYFTKVDSDFKVEAPEMGASTSEITPLMWCARFLKLKHPELPVQLAHRLKQKGYKFCIDMFGSGEELEHTKALITELGVEDCVNLRGNLPNEEILKEMRNHTIFLFTSDRNEGWGAVLNEAMSNGCAVVASNEIGSVPYLVKDGINGLIFQSRNIESLEKKIEYIIDNPNICFEMRKEAVSTMQKIWSPRMAAHNFLDLCRFIMNGEIGNYNRTEGPASWDKELRRL